MARGGGGARWCTAGCEWSSRRGCCRACGCCTASRPCLWRRGRGASPSSSGWAGVGAALDGASALLAVMLEFEDSGYRVCGKLQPRVGEGGMAERIASAQLGTLLDAVALAAPEDPLHPLQARSWPKGRVA